MKCPHSEHTVICYNVVIMSIQPSTITTTQNQPLIGIPFEEDGKEIIRYFSEEAQANKAVAADKTEETLKLAGACSDLPCIDLEYFDHLVHMIVVMIRDAARQSTIGIEARWRQSACREGCPDRCSEKALGTSETTNEGWRPFGFGLNISLEG